MEIWLCAANGALAGAFLLAAAWSTWIYRRDGSQESFLWTALLALTAAAVLAFGAVAITRTGATTYPVALAARDLLQGVSVLVVVRTVASMVPNLNVDRLLQVTAAVIPVHAVLWFFTNLVVVHRIVPGTWPTYGPVGWIAALYAVPPMVAAVLAAVRGTRQVRRWLAGVGLLALLPALGAVLVSSRMLDQEFADLSTAAVGIGVLGLATQRMTAIVARRDVLLSQRVGLTTLAELAVHAPTAELVRAEAERLLRGELGDDSVRVQLGESPSPSPTPMPPGMLQIAGGRNTVSAVLSAADSGELDSQERVFAEQALRIVAGAADRAHAEDEIRHNATHDSLTGLPNRAVFLDRVSGLISSESSTVVVLCGIRGLDDLAAAQGHRVRDEALVAVARALSDMSSAERVLAYLGNGTFGLVESISHRASDAAMTAQLAGLLRTLYVTISSNPATVGRLKAALGTALGQDVPAEELLRDATAALSRAAEQNRSFAVYDADLGARLRRSAETAARLQHALARDEIEVHYQPVVDTHTRQVTSFEALARWRRAGTVMAPAMWIPTAEATGLIHDIGMHILAVAARDQSRLNAGIAVNVSPVQLATADFADRAIAALGDCRPSAIILEVTESAVMADVDHAVRHLQTLRAAGIRIALDDFGTSYSSLSVLADLPVDILKIDRSFVQRMDSPAGVAIVQAIVAMARALGKTTVAEGVETPEQFSELAALGVDRIQGFLVAKPMISRHAERWPRARPMPAAAPALVAVTA